MRILLLSGSPPHDRDARQANLERILQCLPDGSVFRFTLVDDRLDGAPPSPLDVGSMPSRPASGQRRIEDPAANDPISAQPETLVLFEATEAARRTMEIPSLISQAVAYGRRRAVDRVLAVLDGSTSTRMALPVANALSVPLHSLLLETAPSPLGADGRNLLGAAVFAIELAETLRLSRSCATPFWPAAERLRADGAVPAYFIPMDAPAERLVAEPENQLACAPCIGERFREDFRDEAMRHSLASFIMTGHGGGTAETGEQGPRTDGAAAMRSSVDVAAAAPAPVSEKVMAVPEASPLQEVHLILIRGLEQARERNLALSNKLLDAEAQRDRLAARLAQAYDEQRLAEQVRDHYGRHKIALEDLLAETRQRMLDLEARLRNPDTSPRISRATDHGGDASATPDEGARGSFTSAV